MIEDEEDIAAIVRAYLERDGFRVVWAARGTDPPARSIAFGRSARWRASSTRRLAS